MGWFSDVLSAARSWWGRLREPVPTGQLGSVEEVIAQLRALDQALPSEDGVAAFNRMYLKVTELVLARIGSGVFARPDFMVRLDIVFAGLYLEQVSASGPARNKAWLPLFEGRSLTCEPIQFALAGMNAHINHDLPIALTRACRQLGLRPRDPGVRADYDAVTGILAEVQEEVRQSFLEGIALEVDRDLAPTVTLIGNWSIAKARQAAWVTSEALWELHRIPRVETDFLATLSGSVGMASRFLLTPASDLV
jgi:hypothetical protein